MIDSARVETCEHCRNHTDGYGCAFHEARAAHERGECRNHPEWHCFFCGPFLSSYTLKRGTDGPAT
jgi:hypothetical protein